MTKTEVLAHYQAVLMEAQRESEQAQLRADPAYEAWLREIDQQNQEKDDADTNRHLGR